MATKEGVAMVPPPLRRLTPPGQAIHFGAVSVRSDSGADVADIRLKMLRLCAV